MHTVGRRSRQREQRTPPGPVTKPPAPDRSRMARVQVKDETWTAFRVSLGSVPVSVALGRLVEREVAAHRRRTAIDADSVREAVDAARVVAEELRALIARLEQP